MKKNMKIQKLFYNLFFIMQIVTVIYALGFMTDFAELFGLMLKENEAITHFHDIAMQSFNKTILAVAVFGVIVFIMSVFLQIKKYVPDRFALIMLIIPLLFIAVFSIFAITQLQVLGDMYTVLDFSNLSKEGGSEHILQMRTFEIGTIIYAIQTIFTALYAACLFNNHRTYKKLFGGEAA